MAVRRVTGFVGVSGGVWDNPQHAVLNNKYLINYLRCFTMGRKKEKMVSTILWGKRGSPDYYIVEQLMNIRKLNFSDLCREALREWWVRRNNKDFECYVWREEIYKNQETMRSLQRRNDELRLLIKDKHYLTNIELDEFLNNSSIERIIKKKNKDIPDSLKNKPLSNSEVDNVLGVAKGVKNE